MAQNISDLYFTVRGATSGTAVNPAVGVGGLISIAANGTVSDQGSGSITWNLEQSGSVFHLNDLGASGPKQTIIGPAGPGGTIPMRITRLPEMIPTIPLSTRRVPGRSLSLA